ncbi:MAG: response regulator transcription factor, partial [Cyanobacteria bacterium]|nr:response regulator transcription factor [Cyanobacteriota bacterium]
DWLAKDRFHVEFVHEGRTGIDMVRVQPFDAVVLDWDLPDIAGLEVCKELRRRGCSIPILMLTGKSKLNEKELAFDAGADDYLTKPEQIRELSMRIKAVLRRPKAMEEAVISFGELTVESENMRARAGSRELRLMPREFALLALLIRHPDHLFGADALLSRLWMDNEEATGEALRASVKRLRKALDGSGVTVKTIYGQGYRLQLEDSEPSRENETI